MEKGVFKKQTIMVGLIVATWLCITLFGLNSFGLHDGWPAFLVLLFFFESGSKTENLKNIFCGAAIGLFFALGLFKGAELFTPFLGLQAAIFSMVFLAVFLLIVLGDISHTFFNNYAFCYFTVALIYHEQATLQWLTVLFLGGAFIVGGVLFLVRQIHKKPHEASTTKN